LAASQPAVVGYGLIIVLQYRPPLEVCASLIIPKNQTGLINSLQQKEWDTEDPTLRNCLHDC